MSGYFRLNINKKLQASGQIQIADVPEVSNGKIRFKG